MRIRELREKCNLTQQDVADRLDVERSTVAKWEAGASKPRAERLFRLADLFVCPINDLFYPYSEETSYSEKLG